MGIVRDLYYARKMSAGLKLPAPTVALLIKRLRLAAAMGGGVTKTVSGSPAHITDALAKAALSVLVSIEPIQDLHGYDHPWPAGGGVNKLDAAYSESITQSKTFVFDAPLPVGAYTFSFQSSDTSSQVTSYQLGIYKDTTGSYVFYDVYPSSKKKTFTTSETCSKIVLYSNNAYSESVGFTTVFSGLMIESGSSASSWEPYENICPISGRTGLSVYRRGKNLLNAATNVTGYYINSSGVINQDSGTPSSQYTDLIPVEVGKKYTLSLISNRTNSGNNRVHGYDSNGNWVQEINHAAPAVGSDVPFELTGTIYSGISYVRISYGINDVEAMYEEGNSQTSYEPFAYNAYDEDWSTQAGTVYHGTVDPVAGQLTVDWASISSYAGETLPGAWISDRDVYAPGASPTTGAQVVYELATPLTYQLSAQEVQMLLGENYVWSSSGDTVSVTYYAEGNANPLQSLNILLGGNYSNPKTADDVSDREALEIILGGNK